RRHTSFSRDWSSDVCSSDLAAGAAGALISLVVGLPALRIRGLFLAVTTLALAVALDTYVLNFNNFPDLIPTDVGRPLLFERFDQIGRAPCRERVNVAGAADA